MKKLFILISIFFVNNILCLDQIEAILNKYKTFLENGTYENQDWSNFSIKPKSRYETFKSAFNLFLKNKGKIVVELGTTRSFVNGNHVGCNSDDIQYWQPNNPEVWDWGAGFFTRVAAECLISLTPMIYTIDISSNHINRCKIITKNFENIIKYKVESSLDFLKNFNNKIDLLYMDTGDMTPIEPTAQLQLEEAKIVVKRNLIPKNGLILIDDVKNQTPKKFGEKSDFGKAKYSIDFFLKNGFEILANEYQVLLRKTN